LRPDGQELQGAERDMLRRDAESRLELEAATAEKMRSDARLSEKMAEKFEEEARKFREEARLAEIMGRATLLRERKRLREEGIVQDEIDLLLPL